MTRPTRIGHTSPLASSVLGGTGGLTTLGSDGTYPSSGQVPTSTDSNTWAWASNVALITSNTSNALTGPFVNFQSSTGITFAVASNTLTISSTGSGSGSSYLGNVFWVEDYGAVGDDVTDDASAINDATAACMTAGGGWVGFRSKGPYYIGSTLLDTSVRNALLVIPQNVVSGSAPPVSIGFMGVGPTGQWNHGTSGAWDPGTGGTILRTDWAGTITDHPAMLSAAHWDSVYGGTHSSSFNWIEVFLKDIEFRAPANPKLSALELGGTASIHLQNVTLSTNTDSATMVAPTNTSAVGVRGPLIGNANPPYLLDNVFVDGFYTGIVLSEVAHLSEVSVHHCIVGIELAGPQNHAVLAERILFVAVKTGIKVTGGTFYLNIANLHIEHKDSGTFQRVYDFDDGSNYGVGFVVHHTVLAGVGPDDDLTVNGGTGVQFISLSSGSFGGGVSDHGALTGLADDDHTQYVLRSILTTKGDLFARSASAVSRLAVGSNGTSPVADSSEDVGIRWSTSAATGELLITDTPAGTPLVFADLLQNEAQDDLLYGDP